MRNKIQVQISDSSTLCNNALIYVNMTKQIID